MKFVESTQQPGRFFRILPDDWQESIVPLWDQYRQHTRVFTLEAEGKVLGGGLVFSTPSPDTLVYEAEALSWFDKGYLYIGFLWIDASCRGKKLGSRWLSSLFQLFPAQRFWLAVDSFDLAHFYQVNGFHLVREIQAGEATEWIFSYEPGNK